MKIKTSELEGAALDWAVAKVTGANQHIGSRYKEDDSGAVIGVECFMTFYNPSTDWSQGGPLIEECGITVTYCLYDQDGYWVANGVDTEDEDDNPLGETALIAACRAIVSAKLGDEVDIPEGLA